MRGYDGKYFSLVNRKIGRKIVISHLFGICHWEIDKKVDNKLDFDTFPCMIIDRIKDAFMENYPYAPYYEGTEGLTK